MEIRTNYFKFLQTAFVQNRAQYEKIKMLCLRQKN